MSRNRVAVLVGIVGVVGIVTAIAVGWWRHGPNERYLRDLAEHVYELHGYDDGPLPEGGGYRRDHYGAETCGSDRDDWIGSYGLGVAGVDRMAAAERAASALEAEGWTVQRWEGLGPGGQEVRWVRSRSGKDRVDLTYDRDKVYIGVGSGPCSAAVGDFDVEGNVQRVEQFA